MAETAAWIQRVPCHTPGVELHLGGYIAESVAVLKNPQRWKYFALSALGLRLWNVMDGLRSVRQALIELRAADPTCDARDLMHLVLSLRRQGFIQFIGEETDSSACPLHFEFVHPLRWEWRLSGGDRAAQWLYQRLGARLFSPQMLLIAAAVGLAGVVAACLSPAQPMLITAPGLWLLPVLGGLATWLLHEAMHALAVKHFARQVGAVGLGWFWFGPVLFVDTSDMWLEHRWRRIAVTAAGPAVEIICAGAAQLASLHLADSDLGTALAFYALNCYIRVLFNLCPLLEYDGYFMLSDALNLPNLRRRALRWLLRCIRRRRLFINHSMDRLYASYTVLSALYLTCFGVAAVHTLGTLTGEIAANYGLAHLAVAFQWLGGALFVLVFTLAIGKDIRHTTSRITL